VHKNTVLHADGIVLHDDDFDITVERRRLYATIAGSDVASGHASKMTN
jgi:hypothetical protein